uniref:Uncharacterized protein n=1 Tax=Arundo donax TaxID=35708 RepID=A0A0A9DTJ0_ARUDO
MFHRCSFLVNAVTVCRSCCLDRGRMRMLLCWAELTVTPRNFVADLSYYSYYRHVIASVYNLARMFEVICYRDELFS